MLGVLGNPTQEGLDSDVLHQDLSSKASLSQVEKVYSDFHKEMKAVEAAVRPMPMKVREQDNFFLGGGGGGSKFEKMHLYQEKISKKFGKSTKKSFWKVNLLKNPPMCTIFWMIPNPNILHQCQLDFPQVKSSSCSEMDSYATECERKLEVPETFHAKWQSWVGLRVRSFKTNGYPGIPSLKRTVGPLKMDGWKTILSFWGDGLCSRATVSLRRCIVYWQNIKQK